VRYFCLVIFVVSSVFAGVVPVNLSISPTRLSITEENSYAVVRLNYHHPGIAVLSTTEPGQPLLPVLSGNVLIPPDARLIGVRIERVEWQEIGSGLTIYPVQPMRPLSQFNSVPFVLPDQLVYGQDNAYPEEMVFSVPAGSKAGFKIAGFLLCPFRYYPTSGRLLLATEIKLVVEYENTSAPTSTITPGQFALFGADVEQLIINRQDINRWSPLVAEVDRNELDVVIITSATLAPALVNFRNYVRSKGYFTEIVTTDTIYARYPGRDNPEKIRNMLKERFATHGLKYAILAGDVQHVPCRTGYLPYTPYNVPADLYFSDLDGTWDANNNSQFGEYYYTDFNPDSVDLYSDIIVGRLPLDDANHCALFLHKDTLYERQPDTSYLHNVLLPFEALWSNIDYYGRIVNKNIALVLSEMTTWLADSVYSMTPTQCVNSINNGRHLFHFAGHGSYNSFGSTFSTSNLASLNNINKLCIINSMACDCGNFDQYDCLGEQFVTVAGGGAVSTCLNARYGWGAPPTMGPSENLCMEFYRNYTKGINQGRAYALAKDFYRNAAFSQMTYRWSLYDWTFQGDPTMLMWRTAPRTVSIDCPDTIPACPQVLSVQVAYEGYAPAAGARVAVLQGDRLIGRDITGTSGRADVALAAVPDTGRLKVLVTVQDGAPVAKTVYLSTSRTSPLVVYHHYDVDDPNGRLDPGDEADLFLVVANRGNATADSVTATLRSSSSYLTIIDSTSSYGTVAIDDTARGDGYRVRISQNCPQGERLALTLLVRAGSDEWCSNLEITAGMPHARQGIWAVHDTGDFVIGVCANGGIGTTTWRGEGLGFIYPKTRAWSSSAMMHGSFIIGIAEPDTIWVADNYYGTPWQVTAQDFAIVESLCPVIPPEFGDQEYVCMFSDQRHPLPRGLTVTQRSFVSARPVHKDFIILEYRIHNNDTLPITDLWTGVACDFRTAPWNSYDQNDYAGTDSLRALAYVRASPETLALGARPIYPDGATFWANCINHSSYIQDGFTKSEKMRFLDGRLRSTTGTTIGNWHAFVSSGPYTILPGDSQIVAFAICGGRTVAQMTISSDTAFEWYEPQVGVGEKVGAIATLPRITVAPRIFTNSTVVNYQLPRIEPLQIKVADPAGRIIDRFTIQVNDASGCFRWAPRREQYGVFFISVGGQTEKVLRVR